MVDGLNDGPHGTETDRCAQVMAAFRWLYETAGIDQLTKSEWNELLRREIAGRRHHAASGGDRTLDANAQTVVAYGFVKYVFRDAEQSDDEGGEADD